MGGCTSKENQEKIQNVQKKADRFMHHIFDKNSIPDKK